MNLLIDPSQDDTLILNLFDKIASNKKVVQGNARELLLLIDNFLCEQKMSSKDVSGIAVVLGAGRFTGTRVSATIANAWGYAQKIPVLGVVASEAVDLPALAERLEAQPVGVFITASYSKEPNIGKTSLIS